MFNAATYRATPRDLALVAVFTALTAVLAMPTITISGIAPITLQTLGFMLAASLLGYPWGGASVALAETVASTAAWMNIDQATEMAVGLEINANHLRGKREGMVTATALPVHIGRRTQVWQIEIVDEAGKAVCSSRCTIAVVQRG